MDEGWLGLRLDCPGARGVGKIVGAVAGAEAETWLVVRAGRLGRLTAVPVRDAVEGAGRVWVPYPRELLRGAPRIDAQGELVPAAERDLREHYGIAFSD